jgi:hypothetical protein
MVTRWPTHHVIMQFWDSRKPSRELVFSFKALANSLATLGFSAINKLFPKLILLLYPGRLTSARLPGCRAAWVDAPFPWYFNA